MPHVDLVFALLLFARLVRLLAMLVHDGDEDLAVADDVMRASFDLSLGLRMSYGDAEGSSAVSSGYSVIEGAFKPQIS